MSAQVRVPAVRFTAAVERIDAIALVRLPEPASRQLPSRGQVAAQVTVDGTRLPAVLEPDGRKGHWLRVDDRFTSVVAGDDVEVAVEIVPDWPEPEVPADLQAALAGAPERIRQVWSDITPMARWEWVRWVNATANPATRRRRVEVSISKMDSGKRRPCCFDLSACTDPALARNGKLRDPS